MQCPHCAKSYKIKTYYDRHVSMCGLLQQSSKERAYDEEICQDTPTIRELYDMVMEMNHTIHHLKTKISILESGSKQQYKKINILEWLSSQPLPKHSWDEWSKTLQYNQDFLEICFKTNISNSIFECIKQYCEHSTDIPLRAFHQKLNIFYVYKEDTWCELSKKEFEQLISSIHRQSNKEFMMWQQDSIKTLSPDAFNESFTKNLRQINAETPEDVSKKVFNKLYKNIKVNIKNIINFEFE